MSESPYDVVQQCTRGIFFKFKLQMVCSQGKPIKSLVSWTVSENPERFLEVSTTDDDLLVWKTPKVLSCLVDCMRKHLKISFQNFQWVFCRCFNPIRCFVSNMQQGEYILRFQSQYILHFLVFSHTVYFGLNKHFC